MTVKITCTCRATFEIKDGRKHPEEICCPNCGSPLPANATKDLSTALDALSTFESKLESERYGDIFYSVN